MTELEYPFDGAWIVENKKRIRRALLSRDDVPYTDVRIAILGGYTTALVRQCLELFLLDHDIRPSFYESEYARYYEDAMFPNEDLEHFAPDIIYICTSNRNIARWSAMSDSAETVDTLLDETAGRFVSMWERLAAVYHCPVIQNNLEQPYWRLLGNKDAADLHGRVNFVSRLNLRFAEYARTRENFYLCDINWISADYGLRRWSDPFYWHMYKYAVAVPAIPYLSFNVANIIQSLLGKNKKGLVLDLDNTLWGGVVGDDGAENIEIGQETSAGQVYAEFQSYIKAQKDIGVLLAVDSKNDEENALAGLARPDGILRSEDFVSIKANWNPKDRNFAEIAAELNLLSESLVFVDDNPAERHIVREQLAGVRAPKLGESHEYLCVLDRSGFFEVTTLSEDDRKRGEMYRENAARKALAASFSDYREYLLSLTMRAEIEPFSALYMARIAQLTNKSNQFNLTTRRCTQMELEAIAADTSYITLYGKLIDRFGDNGVVSVVFGHIDEKKADVFHIDLWLMSCRVLKRDMEYAMMDALAERCVARGVREICGYYYPTVKNGMVRDFYAKQGFTKRSEDEAGNTVWRLDLSQGYEKKNEVIAVTADRREET